MSTSRRHATLAGRVGGWSASHWKSAVSLWIAFVIGATFLGSAIGSREIARRDQNVGEARQAEHMLADGGFKLDPQDEYIVIQNESMGAEDPRFRAVVNDALESLRPFRDSYVRLRSPYAAGNEGQISPDSHTALVEFTMKGTTDVAKERIDPIVTTTESLAARHPDFYVGEAGAVSTGKALDKTINKQLENAGLRSIPLTLIVLLAVFGSIIAAFIPVILALMAVVASLGLVAFASHAIPTDSNVSVIVLLIGLAVGVDYSLFYLKRRREERANGLDSRAALGIAAGTSGRTVLISGLTVMIAMAGMLFSGDATFMSFAVGTMAVVAVAMVASMTVLPALLSKLGDRADWGRIPFLTPRVKAGGESRVWTRIVGGVMRRPRIWAVSAVALLLILAAPAIKLETGRSGLDVMPADTPELMSLRVLERSFPGGVEPAQLVVKAQDVEAPSVRDAIAAVESEARSEGVTSRPVVVLTNERHTVARVDISLAGDGTNETSRSALKSLREEILPRTIGEVPDVDYAVGGLTAASEDYNETMGQSLPLVFVFVLGFAFLLLLVAFRSLTLATTSILMNLLSVAAAYGVLVAVFQHTWAEGLLGFTSSGAIAPWVPLFLFVILFGLSMDYHVFILSRIREEFDGGRSTNDAVIHGIRATAGVVTSAAIVMVGAFAIFATMPIRDMKEMGIGLAVAVFLDATLVRGVLLPSVMAILGERNWYLPRWLEWLPRIEGQETQHSPSTRDELVGSH